jgi:hypothetical protein
MGNNRTANKQLVRMCEETSHGYFELACKDWVKS